MDNADDLRAKKKALLVSVQLPDVSDTDHRGSLAELGRLVQTMGLEVVATLSQKRKAPSSATVVGEGKLVELAAYTGGKGRVDRFKRPGSTSQDDDLSFLDEGYEDEEEADGDALVDKKLPRVGVVVFDMELTPTQLRNLEEATGVEVLDRTGVILEIFSRHARSREAKMQVEIAKLGYMAPRLRVSNVGGDRQGGGIGAKGSGETAHELDRRRIRDRISELRGQIATIRSEEETRRSRRSEANRVALIGYTNAGKSSLMRALTGSEVLVADKLFATLDTTVRALSPESVPRILVSDTVGFIQKLPHDLVASFRSTLDEALSASLLLYVLDASDLTSEMQLEVTQTVMKEIGAQEIPSRLILNKQDLLTPELREALSNKYPDAIFVSTRSTESVKEIRQHILSFFEKGTVDEEIIIPFTKGHLIGQVREKARVLNEAYDERGTIFTLRGDPSVLENLKKAAETE